MNLKTIIATAILSMRNSNEYLKYFLFRPKSSSSMDDIIELNHNFTLSGDINGPLLAAVISVEMIGGLIANSFVLILTICHIKTWKQPSTIFLTNMLISNLLIVLFVMPFPITTCSNGKWMLGETEAEQVKYCYFAGYLYWYSVLLITQSLVILSFDRFFYIVKSFMYERYMTGKRSLSIVAFSWLIASILNITPFIGLGSFGFINSYGSCGPLWEEEMGHVIYTFIIFIFYIGSIVTTTLWTYCYTRRFLQSERLRTEFISRIPQQCSVYISKEKRLIGLFGMMMVVYLTCYAPGLVAIVAVIFTPLPQPVYASVYVLFLLITVLSPLVQIIFRRDMREAVSKIIKCQRKEGASKCERQNSRSFMLTHLHT
ncbi:PREDICTED: 5-hydroxytryptamine receptor 7-like [Amphimedon queenslandica]|uniref:G-protein coupled receptors family 1 profile domain-containing protein n=2 Tax=Amphimedon queenslandica TaxID=400682 RepID=A0AAN0JF70_AMPQE|nr:PREDICTED: 5-hydroxytryptamine receptor 7-like [Amphimedon queenslandica]|eukprot:XP_019855680.1 PREDICTED: 5-hydroxytryptamine receptor 7-like [Amphimedon queenslandica]